MGDTNAGQTAQLRLIGRAILVSGVVLSAVIYWINAREQVIVLDDSNALGYTRAMDAQMSRLMGHFGLVMMGWNDWITSPIGKAMGVLAVAGLLAGYFYRVAWVLDEEQRERRG